MQSFLDALERIGILDSYNINVKNNLTDKIHINCIPIACFLNLRLDWKNLYKQLKTKYQHEIIVLRAYGRSGSTQVWQPSKNWKK